MKRVIVRLSDGLGNQLFQFSTGFAVANRLGVPLDIDMSWYVNTPKISKPRNLLLTKLLDGRGYRKSVEYQLKYRILNLLCSALAGVTTSDFQFGLPVEKFSALASDEQRMIHRPCYISGYPFSFENFIGEVSSLREMILAGLAGCSSNDFVPQSYAFVHVRRDDLASNPQVRRKLGLLGEDYYVRAMRAHEDRFGATRWVLCSDEPHEAAKVISAEFDVVPSPAADELGDLWLMAHANGGVIANSTFSFWGGLLCGWDTDRIHAPTRWRADGRVGVPLPDLWHRIDV